MSKRYTQFVVFLLCLISPIIVQKSLAGIGVGVGTSVIRVDELLKPGIIYEFPSLSVINTGDEPSEYEAGVEYHDKQMQFRPKREWFAFDPPKFHLEPGQVQIVKIRVSLPFNVIPGDYFAYIEGRPLKKTVNGSASIGVAAAAKLYFTTVPASKASAFYYRILSLWKLGEPWSTRICILIGVIILILILKKFLHIQINVKRPPKKNKKEWDHTDRLY